MVRWTVIIGKIVEKIRLVRKSPAVEVSETTPTSKYFQISSTLIEHKNHNFDLFGLFLQTVQILSILLNFGVKIQDFDFLFSEMLTYDQTISPFFEIGASVDQNLVFKSCSCVRNITLEFIAVSESGLGIKIGQLYAEILRIFHQKSRKITTFQKKKSKNSNFYIFIFFS